jgi:hypothetical protein
MAIAQTIIINIAYVLLLSSFIVNNLYLIRTLSILANIFLLIWGVLFFNYPDNVSLIVWPCVFILINVCYLIKYKFFSDIKISPNHE